MQTTITSQPKDVVYTQSIKQITGVAQRERAGLITPRSLVQTQSPVLSNSCALEKYIVNASDYKQAHKHFTGVAQRKRAVKTPSSTFRPLVVRLEDGYGLHPRGRRIETYHRYYPIR